VTHAAPNLFKFTSLDARERDNALKHTLKTLGLARRVDARVVVLHLGAVEMKDYTDRLIEMVEAGWGESERYQRLCAEADERRETRKGRHLMVAYDLLRRLEDEAARRDLMLGIENREAIEEVPFEGDFPFLFREFPRGVLRYWHDTGHAQIKQHLGFIDHTMLLESMADQLAGFHIHDVVFPGSDHHPPGSGTIRFDALQPFVKPDHLKVLELHPRLSVEEVRAGAAHIKSVWGPE
jgi:sugar phosphate isomerase/epimerase